MFHDKILDLMLGILYTAQQETKVPRRCHLIIMKLMVSGGRREGISDLPALHM